MITAYFEKQGYALQPRIAVGICAYFLEETIKAAELPQDLDTIELHTNDEDLGDLNAVHSWGV